MTNTSFGHKLTDVRVRALLDNPPTVRIEIKDGTIDGLTLRVGPRGRPTWAFRFRVRGDGGVSLRGTKINGARYHRVSLGSYPDVTIKDARRMAATYAHAAAAGKNPLAEFEDRAIDRKDSVELLVSDYLAYAETSIRSWRNAKWTLERHLIPALGQKPVAGITEAEAKNLVNKVAKGNVDPLTNNLVPRPGAANEVRKWCLLLFQWGIDQRRVKTNPFAQIKAPKLGSRQRYLTMDEARAVWKAAGDLQEPWGQAIRLLMLTGCREMEICAARWSWFHADKAELIIPPEHYKSGRHFLVCLPSQAMSTIQSLIRWNDGDFMLSTTNGKKSIAGIPRKMIDKLHRNAEAVLGRSMPRFALHDFRRTVRTHLSRLDVDAHVAEVVLGHAIKGLRASYDIYGYVAEKRNALALWAADLIHAQKDELSDEKQTLASALLALEEGAPLTDAHRQALLTYAGKAAR